MKAFSKTVIGLLLMCSGLMVVRQAAGAGRTTLRGWLSDERCARGRASGGTYEPTNPDCAKQCVAKGAKIVLILPDQKQIFTVANQESAKTNVGDYVEVNGDVDEQAKSIHLDSLKLLTKGKAMCALPRAQKAGD
jgi:hypothetical protein